MVGLGDTIGQFARFAEDKYQEDQSVVIIEEKFKSGSVDEEEMVNDNINTLHEDNIGYAVRARSFVWLEHVDGVANLLS